MSRAARVAIHGTSPTGAMQMSLEPPADEQIDTAALRESFGCKEGVLASALLTQVLNICRDNSTDLPDQDTINAAIAAVHGIAPQDEAESLLATQMVGVHFLAMKLLQRSMTANSTVQTEQNVNMATKMLRTFAAQLEALKRYRSKGEQRVVVQHQHLNVSAGQANVQVNAAVPGGEGAGGLIESGGQAHAINVSDTFLPPLLGQNEGEDALPTAGDAERAMPAPRRKIDRGAKGQHQQSQARSVHRRSHSSAARVPHDHADGERTF